jgi:hypothetical protein
VLALGFSMLFIVFQVGPAVAYELNIYQAYPISFWALLIFSYLLSITLLITEAIKKTGSNKWLIGFMLLIMCNSFLLLLPVFRGYEANGYYDPLQQVGLIKDIQFTGHFRNGLDPLGDFYPAMHIIVLAFSTLTGISINQTVLLFPCIFYGLLSFFLYFFSRKISGNSTQALLVSAIGSLPLITSSNESLAFFVPRILTLCMVPVILVFFLRGIKTKWVNKKNTTLFAIMTISLIFFHPLDGGIFLSLIMVCILLALKFHAKFSKNVIKSNDLKSSTPLRNLIPCILPLIGSLSWFITFTVFSLNVHMIGDSLTSGISSAQLTQYTSWLSRANMPALDIFELFLRTYGHFIILVILAGSISILSIWRLFFAKVKPSQLITIFSTLFIVFAILWPLSMLTGYQLGNTRFISYVFLFAAILIGLYLPAFFSRMQSSPLRHNLAKFTIVLLTFAMVTTAIINVYPSPINYSANQEVTSSDISGFHYFMDHRIDIYLTDTITITQLNLADFIYGSHNVYVNLQQYLPNAPVHFGYMNNSYYGQSIKDNCYFLSNTLTTIYYTQRIPQYTNAWLWTPSDMNQLTSDITVSLVYNNGPFQVSYVKAENDSLII